MRRAIFPGTFDPIHNGHMNIAKRAARLFDELIVSVYDRPLKNLLFTPEERLELAEKTFPDQDNIKVTLFSGLTVDYCKEVDADFIVRGLRVFSDFELEFRMALANHRLAPEIEVVALITHEDQSFISGSSVKEIASLGGDVSSMVPEHVAIALYERFERDGAENMAESLNVSLRD